MAIYVGGKPIGGVYVGGKPVQAVYVGSQLVWGSSVTDTSVAPIDLRDLAPEAWTDDAETDMYIALAIIAALAIYAMVPWRDIELSALIALFTAAAKKAVERLREGH